MAFCNVRPTSSFVRISNFKFLFIPGKYQLGFQLFSRIQTVEIQHKHSIHGFLQSKHEVLLRIFLPSRPPIVSFRDSSGRQAAIRRNHGPGARRRRRRAAGELSRGRARAPPPSPPQRCLLSHITWMERSPSSSSIVTGTTTNPTTEGREKEWQAGVEASRAPSASTFFPCTHSRTGETASEASGRTEGGLVGSSLPLPRAEKKPAYYPYCRRPKAVVEEAAEDVFKKTVFWAKERGEFAALFK